MDETYCRLGGRWAYCYRAIARDGQVVDVYVSERRNTAAVRAFFEWAIAETHALGRALTLVAHLSATEPGSAWGFPRPGTFRISHIRVAEPCTSVG